MCQTRFQGSSPQGTQGGLYPDLSGVQGVQGEQAQAEQTILHFLQALGLAPPHAPPQTPPHAPPADQATAPPQPQQQQGDHQNHQQEQGPQQDHHQQQRSNQQPPQDSQHQTRQEGCPHEHSQQHQQGPLPPGYWWNPDNWNNHWNNNWNNNNWNCRNSRRSYPDCNMEHVSNIFKLVFTTMKTLFRNSMLATCTVSIILLIHFLAPVFLLQNVLFLMLASGLGLHLPTMIAGRVLYSSLGCLGAEEPVLLVGLFVWALHKVMVRRKPLFDRNYWTNRINNFRVDINHRD